MESLTDIVKTITAEISPLIHTPFAFFGHSMGALIAFETARRLAFTHHVSPIHFIASGKSAPQLPSTRPQLHQLPEEPFIRELRRMQGTPEEILQNRELMQLLLPRLRADFAVCETYVYAKGTSLSCPITVLGGKEDSDVDLEVLAAWQAHTNHEFEIRWFEGNHFFLNDQAEAVAGAVAQAIRKQSDKAAAEAQVELA